MLPLENIDLKDLPSETLEILEKMIDTRFEYLIERMYENHSYAINIHENKYLPQKQKMYEILKKGIDTR
jgi:hypothetical protein